MPLLSFPHPSERTPKSAFSNFIRRTESSLEKVKVQALNRLVANKKNNAQVDVVLLGGRRGIRTLEKIAPLHTFQACQFNHSCTLPYYLLFYTICANLFQACQYRFAPPLAQKENTFGAFFLALRSANHSCTLPYIFYYSKINPSRSVCQLAN